MKHPKKSTVSNNDQDKTKQDTTKLEPSQSVIKAILDFASFKGEQAPSSY